MRWVKLKMYFMLLMIQGVPVVSAGAGRSALPCGVAEFLGDGRSVGLSADVLVVGQKFDERGVVVCLEVLERVLLSWLED